MTRNVRAKDIPTIHQVMMGQVTIPHAIFLGKTNVGGLDSYGQPILRDTHYIVGQFPTLGLSEVVMSGPCSFVHSEVLDFLNQFMSQFTQSDRDGHEQWLNGSLN